MRFPEKRPDEAAATVRESQVRRSVKYGLYGAVARRRRGRCHRSLRRAGAATRSRSSSSSTARPSTITTTAADVSGALEKAGYTVGAHDIVAPAADTEARTTAATIVLKRGRLLHLIVDGTASDVWTTAPTVADALVRSWATPGRTSSRCRVPSACRSTPTDIELRSPKQVTVVHDGTDAGGHHDRRDRRARCCATWTSTVAQDRTVVKPSRPARRRRA